MRRCKITAFLACDQKFVRFFATILYHFQSIIGIDWGNVSDLTDETYEEPEHTMLECPHCHHIDRDIHFKKVEVEK